MRGHLRRHARGPFSDEITTRKILYVINKFSWERVLIYALEYVQVATLTIRVVTD